MELIIGLIVIAAVGYIVFRKKDEPVAEAPYKVETPTVTPLGEPPVTIVVEGAGAVAVVEEVKVEVTPVVEAPAKAPRKPRAPKTETVAKPAAKKAAPKKAAAIKAKPRTTRSKKA
jgi:hypothetical protein